MMGEPQEMLRTAQEIDAHLRTIRRALRKPIESEIARGGLTGPQQSVMQALAHADGLSLKELSRRVGLAHSTVSGIVDRLQKRGLLERRADDDDGRISKIVVSQVVRDYLRDTLPAVAISPLLEALRRANPPERKAILKGLRVLRRIIEAD